MLNFVKVAFRGFFEVILWITLVGCAILGGYIFKDAYTIIGVFIGLIVGMFINIVGGGFIATIINIDEDIEALTYNMSRINTNIAKIQKDRKCKKCGELFDSGYSACPHCGSSDFEPVESQG